MNRLFSVFAAACTRFCGSPLAFVTALASILIWAACGPFSRFSDTWQLYANTGTTLVTFLIVFLIQHAQNKDSTALHVKLDAIIKALDRTDDALMGLETADQAEIEAARRKLTGGAARD